VNTLKRMMAVALVAAAASPAAWSAGNKQLSDAQARYNQERARCLSGQSHQDRATCLREAGAALQEAKRGGLSTSSNLSANATARCNAQPAADREACIQRIMGAGSTQGSVEAGGVIRQTETPVK
jgi:hypothetical protein